MNIREKLFGDVNASRRAVHEVAVSDALRALAAGEFGSYEEAMESLTPPIPANEAAVDAAIAGWKSHIARVRALIEEMRDIWQPATLERWLLYVEEREFRFSDETAEVYPCPDYGHLITNRDHPYVRECAARLPAD